MFLLVIKLYAEMVFLKKENNKTQELITKLRS